MPVLLMSLLAAAPQHGYELIRAIEALSDGTYCPSAGSVYPVLARLGRDGLIRSQPGAAARKCFAATDAGLAWLAGREAELAGVRAKLASLARAKVRAQLPAEVGEAMEALKAALFALRGRWGEEQARRVSGEILRAARAVAADPFSEESC
ncbi:hypothetical protein GCM10011289_04360 [Paludibacterium paludis]|uniref:Transcription regulator PadR N-terminal domain-containing protein n=2 Tax=Paludibacterium paludis TaxID=1225769 RepID=A0A918NY40_9NEIS|nr:hypothetical protein GCM10011289_04360 [Paludibacterium paludis]